MRLLIVVILSVFFLPVNGQAQDNDSAGGDSRIKPVTGKVYIYMNRGGNIGLYLGEQGTLIVDTQFEDVTENLLEDVRRISKKPVRYVLNTHHHGDHTGGNANLSKEGAVIISHDKAYVNLINSIREGSEKVDDSILPNITVSDKMTFYFGNEEIMTHHLEKAHTDGDILVQFKKSNVIHTGDAFVNGQYPFIDKDNGGTLAGYLKGLATIYQMCDKNTKIIPGHGIVGNRQDIRKMQQMIETISKKVAFQYLNGKTEEEIIAMNELTSVYDEQGYGDHFITREQFMKMIYDDISAQYNKSDREDTARRIEELRRKQNSEKNGGDGDKGGR